MSVPSNQKLKFCVLCNKETIVVKSDDEYICKICGYIHEKETHWIYTNFSEKQNKPPEKKYKYSNHTGRDHYGKYVNSKLAESLGKAFQKTKVVTSIQRSRSKGLKEIERICRTVDVPLFLRNKVISEFLKLNDAKSLKNRNLKSCVVALLIIFANSENIPLSVSEVLKNSGITRKKYNKEYFYLYHLFSTAMPTSAQAEKHLQKFKSYIKMKEDWPKREKFDQLLTKILEKIQYKFLHGRDAIVTIGAIILYLLKYFEYPETDKFLKLLVINRLTLKNCWNQLLKDYSFLQEYQI